MMTVLGIAVALTLSNFQVASRVEFLHCVSGTVLMQYLAVNRTNGFSSCHFHKTSYKHKRTRIVQHSLARNYDAVKKFQKSIWNYLRMGE